MFNLENFLIYFCKLLRAVLFRNDKYKLLDLNVKKLFENFKNIFIKFRTHYSNFKITYIAHITVNKLH